MPSLNLTLRGYKGHLTRSEKELARILAFVHDNASPRGVTELESTFEKYKGAYKKVEETIEELIFGEEDNDTVNGYERQLEEYSTTYSDTQQKVLTVVKNSTVSNVHLPTTSPHVASTLQKPKICAALKPFQLTAENMPTDLRSWTTKFRVYHSTSGMEQYSTEEQHMLLFSCVSVDLETKIRENDHYKSELNLFGDNSIMEIMREEFDLRFPLFNRRLEFFRYEQAFGQKFTDFMVKLKQMGEEANLHALDIDSLYVFRYLTGVVDSNLRERFLKLDNPTLVQLKGEARAYEIGIQAARAMDKNIVSKVTNKNDEQKQRPSRNKFKSEIPKEMKGKCWVCGSTDHTTRTCTIDKERITCSHCNKKGHRSTICMGRLMNKNLSSSDISTSKAHSRTHSSSTDDEHVNSIYCRGMKSLSNRPTPKLNLQFRTLQNRNQFDFSTTPDTGATRTIIALDVLNRHKIRFKPTLCRLFTANGYEMSCSGEVDLKVTNHSNQNNHHIINAIISCDLNNEILVSWHDLQALGVISSDFPQIVAVPRCSDSETISIIKSKDIIANLKHDFSDVLSDSLEPGAVMNGPPMKIHLRKDIEIHPRRQLTARKIPLHHQHEADICIKKLLFSGVIIRVETPTDWVSSGHFVPKPNGSVRLVTDYTNLNEFVERPVHPFPTGLDIIQNLNCASKWFAKLDAVSGYFQIPLEERSRLLTTFLIPQGRFCYTRAPMGLNASGDEWCYRSDLVLEGLEGVHKLVDDILIEATTLEELYVRLKHVLVRCRKKGLHLNLQKFEIGRKIKFAGHIVSDEGTQPDPSKLDAIANFKSPANVTELRSFLGLANQLGHFIPDLAQATSQIRKLLKKNIAYQWLSEHEIEFQKVKMLLTSDMLVKPFDKTLSTELLTDASRLHGLGFALIQYDHEKNIRLIACGSRSLTATQSRYATIELECLAVQWSISKCEFWLRGITKFKVVTDHRPLVGIFKKPLYDIENPRLQRLRGKLYDFNFETEWKPGKDHLIADALSRSPVWPAEEDGIDHVQVASVRDAVNHAITNTLELDFFSKPATTCKEYQQLISALKNGKLPNNLPTYNLAKSYSKIWDRLSLYEDEIHVLVLFDGHRVIVPCDIRHEVLRILHLSHQGLVKTKQLARRHYYWPGMNMAIKNLIYGCRTCLEFLPSQSQEPFLETNLPKIAMTHVSVDLFDALGRTYIVMVCRFSGYIFVSKIRNSSALSVTNTLLKWFYDFGFPDVIRTDGGPCFRTEFREFCHQYFITHELSSAYNPTSNGLAEAAVKNSKRLLQKCQQTGQNFDEALSEFRLMPRADGFSPSDLMFSRTPRGLLPAIRTPVDRDAGYDARQKTLESSSSNHSSFIHLPSFRPGDIVVMQDPRDGKWSRKGSVVAIRNNFRSYEIESDGKMYLRNRRFIRPDRTLK